MKEFPLTYTMYFILSGADHHPQWKPLQPTSTTKTEKDLPPNSPRKVHKRRREKETTRPLPAAQTAAAAHPQQTPAPHNVKYKIINKKCEINLFGDPPVKKNRRFTAREFQDELEESLEEVFFRFCGAGGLNWFSVKNGISSSSSVVVVSLAAAFFVRVSRLMSKL